MIRATYFDGRTAAAQAVTVTEAVERGGGLRLTTEAGRVDDWPRGSFRLASRDREGVRLETVEELPRLLTGGADLLALALAADPSLGAAGRGAEFPFRKLVLWAVPALAAGYVLFAYGLPLFGTAMARLVPLRWEEQLGKSITDGIAGKSECKDVEAAAAVKALVDSLAATVESPYTYRVRISGNGHVNALAAPGGYMVVFRGLIDKTETPEELAAVLAHEMQHVTQRHVTAAIVRGLGLTAVVSILVGDPSFLLGAGTLLSELHFHREDERRADLGALEMLARIRADPRAMSRVMRMLQKEAPDLQGPMKYLSTHPLTEDRIAWAEQAAREAKYMPVPVLKSAGKWPPALRCEAVAGRP